MSNINRFLNSDTSGSFSNDGTVNLNVNSVKIAGLLPSMPVMSDNSNNLISVSTISVPSGTLTLGSAPSTTVIRGGASQIFLNDTTFNIGVGGSAPLNVTASDITLNGASVVLQGSPLLPSMPVMLDSSKKLISASTISVPSGTLTLGSSPATTVVRGGASSMLLNDTAITVSVGGSGPLSVTASDITLNGVSVIPSLQYFSHLYNSNGPTGYVIPQSPTLLTSTTAGFVTNNVISQDFTTGIITVPNAGVYKITCPFTVLATASFQGRFQCLIGGTAYGNYDVVWTTLTAGTTTIPADFGFVTLGAGTQITFAIWVTSATTACQLYNYCASVARIV